jgi:hypothetical protein
MFKQGDYIFRTVEGMRYVYRVMKANETHYEVQCPYFVCWGSTFARWSPNQSRTKKYIEKNFTLLPDDIAKRYAEIKKDQPTSILFKEDDQ